MTPRYEVFDGLANQMPEIPPGSVASQVIFLNDKVSVVLIGFPPGEELIETQPDRPAILEFWRGDGLVILGSEAEGDAEAYEVGPGSWVYVDAGTPHQIQARTQMLMLLTLL
jgi:quercetin dioxygenase-like cupin family protein